MKRILFSTGIIVFTIISVTVGGTGAFFSDKETSTGNTFTAGTIDLKIDNTSYYNGSLNPETSWSLHDLTIEKFFDFLDIKPGDIGEDTISLHVDNNDAYACANVKLTSNDDNGLTGPESLVDKTDGPGQGELAQNINFIWWADDGDNVLEQGENILPGGNLGNLQVGSSTTVTLADSSTNIWDGSGPISGGSTHYIGKAWCFGNITANPLPQDGLGTTSPRTPANSTGGVTCDGSLLDNSTQGDSLTADVSFTAVQARHNSSFLCGNNVDSSCKFDNSLNLVADGGFESPIVSTPDKWDVFASPVDGWNVEWRSDIPTIFGSQTRPIIPKLELHRGVLGPASEGEQYAELDTDWGGPADSGTGEPASVGIYQDIPTIPGASYKLKFAFAPRPNTSADENNLRVSWGGSVVNNSGPVAGGGSINWSDMEVDVIATTTTTRLEFTDMGTPDSAGTFLDNVRLTQQSCVN